MYAVSASDPTSPSSRRAWIEITPDRSILLTVSVALLAEGVDRNLQSSFLVRLVRVALLAEGVDRNKSRYYAKKYAKGVALLAEGVGNSIFWIIVSLRVWSPSSRRAWIEMPNAASRGS